MAVVQKIPTNIITGVLGAGKTTAIQSLIDQKPEGERWAIVINEYGQVAIDNALIDQPAEVQVMELASGCVCCTMSYAFEPLLAQLIRQVKPHRLIIEPSGAGHPARLIDMLRGENFGKVLDLGSTLCIVDPADFDNPRIADSTLFNDQLHMSDAIVISWIDKRSPELIQACKEKVAKLEPHKQYVYETSRGKVQLDWLDAKPDSTIIPVYDPAHPIVDKAVDNALDSMSESVTPPTIPQMASISLKVEGETGKPRRFQNQGNGTWACGWIFAPNNCFDRDSLMETLESVSPIQRLKGIFHCEDDWWSINRKASESSLKTSAFRSDSRLEIIADQPLDWDAIEASLISCIVETPPF